MCRPEVRHTAAMTSDVPASGSATAASVPCVGAVIADADGRLVLVRRANPPHAGLWSLPGGRVERGETREQAVVREVAEETGLRVHVERRVGRVSIGDYDVVDFACRIVGGSLVAGSDAADAAVADPRTLDCTSGLVDILTGWGVLPGRPAVQVPAVPAVPAVRPAASAAASHRRTVVLALLVALVALPLIALTLPTAMASDACSAHERSLACGRAGEWAPGVTLAVGVAAPALAGLGALARRRGGRVLVMVAAAATAVTWVGALAMLIGAG